jgi:hypothetical protein
MNNFVLKLLDEAVIEQVKHIKTVEREIEFWESQKPSQFTAQRVRRWKEQKEIHLNRMDQCSRASRMLAQEYKTKRA